MKLRTTRDRALAVECPHCHAVEGDLCTGARGNHRISQHAERHEAAVRAGAPLARELVATGPVSRTRRPRRPRRLQARWNDLPFICAGPCGRYFPTGSIRFVTYEGEKWCDQDYRRAAGLSRT